MGIDHKRRVSIRAGPLDKPTREADTIRIKNRIRDPQVLPGHEGTVSQKSVLCTDDPGIGRFKVTHCSVRIAVFKAILPSSENDKGRTIAINPHVADRVCRAGACGDNAGNPND